MESTNTHCNILGVMETKSIYNKRNKSTRDIEVINKHLNDAREAGISTADKNIGADKFKLGFD